ncbi:Gfo/Idh/MocA family protein [Yersinia kristensenii]|uniref:Gfo/Idh/MocA family protein n=1 Tax=Yersinia kristensenii TaxID=28152 RepID=UPI0005E87B45|nr:Gfo/Idh/MocA family oxidoreductase [Yersinia kristensenii]CNH30426.1 putative oxidoreductase [Yersinia kristensenii]CNK88792.1 putative oxidoreductase [Yersinia kristensenii]
MTSRLKGAVIGCGFFAQNHLAGWQDIADVEIVAVCDLDIAKAKAAAEKFGIAHYTDDVNALFATHTLDFVDLPTTMETHEALVAAAVAHHIPVIVQKPFAPDLDGCRRMVAMAQAANVPLMVHEDFRFQNVFRAARKIIDSGELGELTFGRLSWRTAIDVYSNQPYLIKVKRFMIMDVGIHLLDLARFLFGDAHGVFCRTQQIKAGIAGEDAATILLSHDNGATTVLDFSYASQRLPDPFPQTLVEIEGTAGTLLIGANQVITVHANGQSRQEKIAHDGRLWASEPWTQIQDSVVHTQRHFITCLRQNREPETSGRDSLLTYGLLEAAYLSASTARQVQPERD